MAAKKSEDNKKTTKTKSASTKKTATKKVAKKTKTKKATTKKAVAKKATSKKTVTKKAETKTSTKKVKKARVRKDPLANTHIPELNIVDAVAKKPQKITKKPGQVIAMRDKEKPEDIKPDLTMEEYKPPRRSILDNEENVGPVYRYSDDDLQEFKAILLEKLEKAKADLAYFQNLITRKNESGTSDTDNRINHAEDGSAAMEREQISQLASRQTKFIEHLENALVRIENKTYGVCRVTGKLIDKNRLKAVPHATLSIEAKKKMR